MKNCSQLKGNYLNAPVVCSDQHNKRSEIDSYCFMAQSDSNLGDFGFFGLHKLMIVSYRE